MKYLYGLLVLSTMCFCTEPKNDFQVYVESLNRIELPLYFDIDTRWEASSGYDSALFEKYKHAWTVAPLGVLFQSEEGVGILAYSIADQGLAPFLSTYDWDGHKIDSLSFFEKTGVGETGEGYDYIWVDEELNVSIIDSTTSWKLDENYTEIPSSYRLEVNRRKYKIGRNGKIEEDGELNLYSGKPHKFSCDCAPYYQQYCKERRKEECYQEDECHHYIKDSIAFCAGVKGALLADGLVLRSVGDPTHASACWFQSFQKYGVSRYFSGDIIYDEGVFDFNGGFNLVMVNRIKKELGEEQYRLLGKVDSSWFALDQENLKILKALFRVEEQSDSTILVRIDEKALESSVFEQLNGVTFSDSWSSSRRVDFQELKEKGVLLLVRKSKTSLKMNFDGYDNPLFCKRDFGNIVAIPIRLKNNTE